MKAMTSEFKSYYPMNFQHKIMGGGNEIEIDLCHYDRVEPGAIFKINHVPNFKVTEIVEQREPAIKTPANPNNVNHHPEGVMFYKLKGFLIL